MVEPVLKLGVGMNTTLLVFPKDYLPQEQLLQELVVILKGMSSEKVKSVINKIKNN
jgi:hypothetical protein